MKNLLVILSLLTFCELTVAQDQDTIPKYPNNVFIGLLGNGMSISVNYERLITHKSIFRTGLGYLPKSRESAYFGTHELFFVPVEYYYQISTHLNSRLELGFGATLIFVGKTLKDKKDHGTLIFPNAILGYRYQPMNSGFMMRITFAPFWAEGEVVPWGGLSFGYNW